ncbi:hypothetical protein [Nordella sp. HKS 07]|uniref:hypothetical protein n=1 Tax=Nordella sp. HKS 07 TaxID=2712222 RepID=UPI001FEE514A|nr:hypothetical protein [Nordella sp. HKS 07]
MALLRASIALFLLLVLSLPATAQDKVVDSVFAGPTLDLFPYLLAVETDKPVVTIRTAEDATGLVMELPAKGTEPVHRWVVVTLANSGSEARDLVVSTPHQGFAGSGVIWPKPIGSRIQNVVAAGQATIAPLRVINADAFALRIEPKGRVTVAMELTRAGLDEIELWQRAAFDGRVEQNGFYRGVILGIAMVLGVIALSLYAVRSIAVFPFASVFIWASIGFIALESGYLPQINDVLPKRYELGPEIRAVIEGLMLIGLILCLVSFADLRKRRPVAGNVLLLVAGLMLALPVYGWFEPARASGMARLLFAAVAGFGLFILFAMLREGLARARLAPLLGLDRGLDAARRRCRADPRRRQHRQGISFGRSGPRHPHHVLYPGAVRFRPGVPRSALLRRGCTPRPGAGRLAAMRVGLAGGGGPSPCRRGH